MTTVTFTLKTPDGVARNRVKVTFLPKSTPNNVDGDLITNEPVVAVTNSSGMGSVQLMAGDYVFRVPGERDLPIAVNGEDETHDVVELTTDNILYTPQAGTSTPSATAARAGKVKTLITDGDGDPVVPLVVFANGRFINRGGTQLLQAGPDSEGKYHDMALTEDRSDPANPVFGLTLKDVGEE